MAVTPYVGPVEVVVATTVTPIYVGQLPGAASLLQVKNVGANPGSVEIAYSPDGVDYIIDYNASNSLSDIGIGEDPRGVNFSPFPGSYIRIRGTGSGGSTTIRLTIWALPASRVA